MGTHPDFKSIDPSVRDAQDMDDYIAEALWYQSNFDRRTTPWEMNEWDYDQLQSFNIDLTEVDRLYHIYFYEEAYSGRDYRFIARVNYNNQLLYVELTAGCDYCQGRGFIFVSKDPNLFMQLVLTSEHNKDLVYQSLMEDGIEIERQYDDAAACGRIKTIPMLKYLCHESAFDNRVKLQPYFSTLPSILRNSIDEFIRFRDAQIAYDAYWDAYWDEEI